MRSIRDKVVMQALIEYVMARAPSAFDDENPTDADLHLALEAYVERRYSASSQTFRLEQKLRIIPNIRAALAGIEAL